jgi:polynucleotide 5'-kinase involved in rRNA processing
MIEFLRDFEWKDDCLLVSKENLILTETSAPFQNLDEKMLNSNNSLLILGKKNSGKSTLSEYLKNIKPESFCILDCDIGRSLSISGCVSLLSSSDHINLWIGEFTPFNCIEKYVAGIRKLYEIYREKYFSKKLVINTMGYLSGVGEMVIYEIYHLINPS